MKELIIKKIGCVENFVELTTFCIELHKKLKIDQISLQVSGSNTEWNQSSGRLKNNHNEFLFDQIHPSLKNSIIEYTIKLLPLKVTRLRLLALKAGAKYTWHRDPTPRIHIPIVTNDKCFFSFPNNSINEVLKADGSIYWTDTRKLHSYINMSEDIRLHIVGVVNE